MIVGQPEMCVCTVCAYCVRPEAQLRCVGCGQSLHLRSNVCPWGRGWPWSPDKALSLTNVSHTPLAAAHGHFKKVFNEHTVLHTFCTNVSKVYLYHFCRRREPRLTGLPEVWAVLPRHLCEKWLLQRYTNEAQISSHPSTQPPSVTVSLWAKG